MDSSDYRETDEAGRIEAQGAPAAELLPPEIPKPAAPSPFEGALGRQLSKVSGALETIFSRADKIDPADDSYAHAQSSHYDSAAKLMKASAKLVQAAAELNGKKLDKTVTIRNEHIGFIPKSLVAVPSDKPVIDAKPAHEPDRLRDLRNGTMLRIGPALRSKPGAPLDIRYALPDDDFDPECRLTTGEVFVVGKGWVLPPPNFLQKSEGSNGNFG